MADQGDVKALLLQVDASVELARRNLSSLERDVARSTARMDVELRKVDTAFGRMGAAAATARNLVGGFIAGIGIQGVASVGKAILQSADDIEAAAKKAGISVERYQSLTEAFRRLEIDAEAVDPILKRLNATLGQVQNSTENGATKALDRLGISAKVLKGEITTADQLLDAIADSSRRAGSDAQYAADLVDILGRRYGVDLAAALRNGGAALKQAEADIKSAGGVISELAITNLADANERIDRFVARAKISFTQFVGDALAAFESADRVIDNFILRRFGTQAGKDGAARRLFQTPEGIDLILETEREKLKTIQARGGGANYFPGAGPRRTRSQAEIDQQARIDRYTAIRNGLLARRARESAADASPVAVDRPAATPRVGRTATARGFDPFFSANLDGLSGDLARQYEGRFDVDPLIAAMIKERGGLSLEDRVAKIDEVKDAELRRIEIVAQAEEEANRERERFYDNISRNLSQAIVYGQDLGEALVNSFKAAAAEALASGLFDFLKGGGGGGVGGLFASIGAAFGAGRALGGPVMPGQVYTVGERGPEPFIPSVPGRIVSNGAMGGGGQMSLEVEVKPSPLFEVTVAQTSATAGAQAARGTVRQMFNSGIPRV